MPIVLLGTLPENVLCNIMFACIHADLRSLPFVRANKIQIFNLTIKLEPSTMKESVPSPQSGRYKKLT